MRFVLLFALLAVVTAAKEYDFPPITCKNIEPFTDYEHESLMGDWVVVMSVNFKDGFPFNSEDLSTDPRTSTCIYQHLFNTTTGGFETMEKRFISNREPTMLLSKYTNFPTKGIYSIHTDNEHFHGFSAVMVDAVPEKFVVFMQCSGSGDTWFPVRLVMAARHVPMSDMIVPTPEEIMEGKTKMATKLGFLGYGVSPVSYATSCWKQF